MSPIKRVLACIRKRWYIALVAVIVLVSLVIFGISTVPAVNRAEKTRSLIVECTSPGPKPPPITGHRCYDEGARRTAAAVAAIVDSNQNGIPDVQDLAAALGVSLPPPTVPVTPSD